MIDNQVQATDDNLSATVGEQSVVEEPTYYMNKFQSGAIMIREKRKGLYHRSG